MFRQKYLDIVKPEYEGLCGVHVRVCYFIITHLLNIFQKLASIIAVVGIISSFLSIIGVILTFLWFLIPLGLITSLVFFNIILADKCGKQVLYHYFIIGMVSTVIIKTILIEYFTKSKCLWQLFPGDHVHHPSDRNYIIYCFDLRSWKTI